MTFRVAIGIATAVVLAGTAADLAYVATLHNGTSPISDPWSEADTIRAAQGYVEKGFVADEGLPDIAYGRRFPNEGVLSMAEYRDLEHAVYLHYPPGPYWLAGLSAKIFGLERVDDWRLLPIAVAATAMIFFAATLARVLGAKLGLVAFALLSFPPMVWNMMHALQQQSYVHALLLVLVSLLLRAMSGASPTQPWRALLGVFATSHLIGWMTFDAFFLAAFAWLPLWLLLRDDDAPPASLVLGLAIASLAGFASAHLLHFLQVVGYLGGVRPALAEFAGAARYRAAGGDVDPDKMRLASALRAYIGHFSRTRYFSGAGGAVAAVLLLPQLAPDLGLVPRWRWSASRRLGVLAAIGISFAWVIVMRQHAVIHVHFVPRHLYLGYLTIVLGFLLGFRTVRSSERGERSRPAEAVSVQPDAFAMSNRQASTTPFFK